MRPSLLLTPGLAVLLSLAGCGIEVAKDDSATSETGESEVPVDEIDDADGDTIADADEGELDTDGDGTPDYMDTDSDNDGLPDSLEAGDSDASTAPVDSDSDGSPDYRDPDSDNNCVEDSDEGDGATPVDSDGDGVMDAADPDNDGDGIADEDEIGGSCYPVDTDGDGSPDYLDPDSDEDGIADSVEGGGGDEPVDTDGDGRPDYLDPDSDGDGTGDAEEGGGEDTPRDTDGDGTPDYADTDSDGDAIEDASEAGYGTDPYDSDTDGDGYSDGGEVVAGTDPTDADDLPGEDYVVLGAGETDTRILEFILEGSSTDLVFLVDTTCSMSGTLTTLTASFDDIIDDLLVDMPDLQAGFATFDDYAYASYGSAGSDKPFLLQRQVTSDFDAVEDAIDAAGIHSGADGPESGMEALYQALTGDGYDQDCDGEYDTNYDVPPFLASEDDPFGGEGGQGYDDSDSSTGSVGGLGFRDYALPVIVYITDNYLRDPESDNATLNGSPGGCPLDAGAGDVVSAATAIGAQLVGVNAISTIAVDQMEYLAESTDSYDADGEPNVIAWAGSDADDFQELIVETVSAMGGTVGYSSVSVVASDDPYGFVTDISPDSQDVDTSDLGESFDFTVELTAAVPATTEDQIFTITFEFLADDAVLLDTRELIVVVPAAGG